MRICDNRHTPTVLFASIAPGEVFTDGDGDYMMKIKPAISHLGEEWNVVDLCDGHVYSFTDDYQCIKVNAIINVTD